MFFKRHLILLLLASLTVYGALVPAFATVEPKVLYAHFRHRPPEMIVDERTMTMSSPLKDIIEEAAEKIGYRIHWTISPFARSLHDLQVGKVDIVPRTIKTSERETFIRFLGPVSTQTRDILFLVKAGKESSIQVYEDLYKLSVGVKRQTVYFERFNDDTAINKMESIDDENMAKMFIKGRFDTMIILDRASIEYQLNSLGFHDFSYAQYRQINKIDNYFGMSRKSAHFAAFESLNNVLIEMVRSGRVKAIYDFYGLSAELE